MSRLALVWIAIIVVWLMVWFILGAIPMVIAVFALSFVDDAVGKLYHNVLGTNPTKSREKAVTASFMAGYGFVIALAIGAFIPILGWIVAAFAAIVAIWYAFF